MTDEKNKTEIKKMVGIMKQLDSYSTQLLIRDAETIKLMSEMYKKEKENYLGHVGDVAEMVRIAMTTSKNSPNLYQVLSILGIEEVRRRINLTISKF